MRRNLRLDWRALALLGALLSIIIDWPGLVYAMPTILPPVAALAADAAPIDTLNIIKNDEMLSFSPPAPAKNFKTDVQDTDDPHHNAQHRKDSGNEQFNSFSTSSTTTTATTTTTAAAPTSLFQDEVKVKEKALHLQQRITTINEKQQQQVNENYNSISDKQINDKEQDDLTAIQKIQQNSTESAALDKVSLLNTHNTKNSTFNSISLTKSNTTTSSSPTTSTPSPISSTSTSTFSTTESSAKIQSTLMPPTLADQADLAEQSSINSSHLSNSYKFSSYHHLAILSRTERSIRSSSSTSTSNASSWGMLLESPSSSLSSATFGRRTSSTGGLGVLVRRSSDTSVMKSKRLNNSRNLQHKNNLDRNERSTVSHLSGPSRKIQLYIKNRFIQLLPDGTVNGTQDEQCDYTILQRSTVEVGRIKIQGVATCLYLCMDPCGAVYGSKEFTDDCVFNESMEQHNYNTYSSTYNSNTRRKYYLALNRHGEPRKLQIPPSRSLGKLATYTNAIPETVPQERVEQLIAKNFGANRVKHGIRQLCDTGKPLIELIDSKNFKARPKCNPNNSNSNSNNNSNSKNTLSRNLDKENSLGVNNQQQQQQQQQTTNANGQVLNNVPAANDKSNLSSNSRSSSSSNSNSNSKPETNRDSSSSSPSSISISQNNGHISNSKPLTSSNSLSDSSLTAASSSSSSSSSSISNSTAPHAGSHRGGKKPGKKRKCKRFENELQHNCTTPLNRPTNISKRGNQLGPLRQQKCQNLLMQQQQAGVTDIVLPPMCTKKGGSKNKQGNSRKGPGKNGLGTDGLGPNNRRGKKLNLNRGTGGGRQGAKNNQNNNGGSKKKQKNSKRGGGSNNNNNNNNKKNNKKSLISTTEKANEASTSSQSSATSTLRPKNWETTSLTPSTTMFDSYDPHAESTSDRGDREQRNVRYSNSMEEYLEQSSEETSSAEDLETDDNEMENNEEINEDASYEDDSYGTGASSSHIPYAAADFSHTPLTGGSDDFLYYDQLDL